MQPSTAQNLKAIAPKILSGEIKGDEPFLPGVAKRAIAIYKILDDGEWHTTTAIALEIGISPNYVRTILQVCRDPWGLASSKDKTKGFMLVKPDSVIIV